MSTDTDFVVLSRYATVSQSVDEEDSAFKLLEERISWLTYIAKINLNNSFERNSNSYLQISASLLYLLSYRVNWEQYARFIHCKDITDSSDNLTRVRQDMQCFDCVSESSLRVT